MMMMMRFSNNYSLSVILVQNACYITILPVSIILIYHKISLYHKKCLQNIILPN